MPNSEKILEVNNLSIEFQNEEGSTAIVKDVSFQVRKKEIVAIVGESGSGKSLTVNSILNLLPVNASVTTGEVKFRGDNLLKLSNKKMRAIRGNDISMIFQEPMTSLNPLFTVGDQIQEIIKVHQDVSKQQAKELTIQMLNKVEIPRADKVFSSYPHSLSGGMRQRVMIAMALACNPKLLIADEPTTALDVTIQAQILELMKNIKNEEDASIILITHDLGVVAEMADRVIVMYAGQVVEDADVYELFKNPKHPYTKKLLESMPKMHENQEELVSIEGTVPHASNMPSGCYFHLRCPLAMDACKTVRPKLTSLQEGRKVRCLLFEEEFKEVVNGG